MSGLIWIQTVHYSDGKSERLFGKCQFKKISRKQFFLKNYPAQGILVLKYWICLKLLNNVHVKLSSETRGLSFYQCINLLPYLVCASSDDSHDTHMPKGLTEPSLVEYALLHKICYAKLFEAIVK